MSNSRNPRLHAEGVISKMVAALTHPVTTHLPSSVTTHLPSSVTYHLPSSVTTHLPSSVTYHLPVGDQQLPLNEAIGKNISLKFTGKIVCRGCEAMIKKSYQEGFCFPCTRRLACCDFCVLKPDRCHFHKGTCREPEWGLTQCMIPHVVYLANSTGIKVGLTRHHQIPTRWIDQGAIQAMPLFKVPTRQVAGFVEVAIAEHISDATNWRALIQRNAEPMDMKQAAEAVLSALAPSMDALKTQWGEEAIQYVDNADVTQLSFPIEAYPSKCATLSFDKTPHIEGTLLGIKGQYLFFKEGALNIRKHQGYEIVLKLDDQ